MLEEWVYFPLVPSWISLGSCRSYAAVVIPCKHLLNMGIVYRCLAELDVGRIGELALTPRNALEGELATKRMRKGERLEELQQKIERAQQEQEFLKQQIADQFCCRTSRVRTLKERQEARQNGGSIP